MSPQIKGGVTIPVTFEKKRGKKSSAPGQMTMSPGVPLPPKKPGLVPGQRVYIDRTPVTGTIVMGKKDKKGRESGFDILIPGWPRLLTRKAKDIDIIPAYDATLYPGKWNLNPKAEYKFCHCMVCGHIQSIKTDHDGDCWDYCKSCSVKAGDDGTHSKKLAGTYYRHFTPVAIRGKNPRKDKRGPSPTLDYIGKHGIVIGDAWDRHPDFLRSRDGRIIVTKLSDTEITMREKERSGLIERRKPTEVEILVVRPPQWNPDWTPPPPPRKPWLPVGVQAWKVSKEQFLEWQVARYPDAGVAEIGQWEDMYFQAVDKVIGTSRGRKNLPPAVYEWYGKERDKRSRPPQFMMDNRMKEIKYSQQFRTLFGVNLHPYMSYMFGFDIIKFDEYMNPPDGTSLSDYITKKYGKYGNEIIKGLL